MKTIRFDIPKGYSPTNIKEFSEGEDHYIEVDLIGTEDICTIKMPHDCGVDCNLKKIDKKALNIKENK